MNRINHSREDHAFSRYMCVSEGAIDKLQRDYLAGRNLAQSIPGIDATMAAVIIAESLEADHLWDTLPEMLLGKHPPEPQGEVSDFGRATLAELFFATATQAREAEDEERALIPRLDELEVLVDYGSQRVRALCAERGLNWDQLTEDERERLVDELLHEA